MPVKEPQVQHKSKFRRMYDRPVKGSRWKDEYYVRIFRLARQGLTDTLICHSLGVDKRTFFKWRDSNPAVQDALAQARTEEAGAGSLNEYVHGRLPPKLARLWKEIVEVDQMKDDSVYMRRKRVEKMLADRGERVRQQMWLHALVHSNFNKFEACRKTNVSRMTVQKWINDDPQFLELVDAVVEMKKEFVEGCLFGLIGQGDSAATIFAARTLLRDRGYDPKITIVSEKTVRNVKVDLDKVIGSMSTEAKREFLKSLKMNGGEEVVKSLPPRKVVTETVDDGEDDDE